MSDVSCGMDRSNDDLAIHATPGSASHIGMEATCIVPWVSKNVSVEGEYDLRRVITHPCAHTYLWYSLQLELLLLAVVLIHRPHPASPLSPLPEPICVLP